MNIMIHAPHVAKQPAKWRDALHHILAAYAMMDISEMKLVMHVCPDVHWNVSNILVIY